MVFFLSVPEACTADHAAAREFDPVTTMEAEAYLKTGRGAAMAEMMGVLTHRLWSPSML